MTHPSHTQTVRDSLETNKVAARAYRGLMDGNPDAIYELARFLVSTGMKVDIKGTTIVAKSSTTRKQFPEIIIYEMHGYPPALVEPDWRRSGINYVVLYYTAESCKELFETIRRTEDVDGASETSPDGDEEEGDVLR